MKFLVAVGAVLVIALFSANNQQPEFGRPFESQKLMAKIEGKSYKPKELASKLVSESEADAKAFIYHHESTNRLDAVNDGGCYGLGQDCNDVLANECPNWRTDRPCQDKFWDAYAKRRYGSWVKAKAHWQARVPINGKDVGNWW